MLTSRNKSADGMTLIELMIVVTVVGILLVSAAPSYRQYLLRVHRTEAIRMLLLASMCQERISASQGSYDTGRCRPGLEQQRYQLEFLPENTQGKTYVAMAVPQGAQRTDLCGSLSLDQSGARQITGTNISKIKCWNGR
jgi:type IV pilus assembly protein PilE